MSLNHRYKDTLSTFTANFEFPGSAASLAVARSTAHGTMGRKSGCVEYVRIPIPIAFSCSLTSWTIPVARGITVGASRSGHTAPPNNAGDSDVVSHACQSKTSTDRGGVTKAAFESSRHVDIYF
jgi:hypothetical protein